MRIFCLILVLCFTFTCGFNIDTSSSNVIVRSKMSESFSDVQLTNASEAAYFGYSMFVDTINWQTGNSIQLAVSAPLEMTLASKLNTDEEDLIGIEPSPQKRSPSSILTPAMGVVYICDVLLSRFMNLSENNIHNCTRRALVERHLTGVEISDRDALGMSVMGQPLSNPEGHSLLERSTITTCSPLRQRECGTTNKAEGACYISEIGPGRGDSEMVIKWKKLVPCRESCISRNIDLMYVIDGSYSVGRDNFEKVKNWIKEVTNGFDVTEQVQVGVVQYSYYNETYSEQRWINTEILLGKYKDKEALDFAIDRIAYHGYKTYTAHAITKTVREDFNGPKNRYPNARRVMILLTDGKADDAEELPNATLYAGDNGVESFAIGIGDYDSDELNLIAGEEDKVFTVEDFENLKEIVSRLQNDIQVLEGSSSPDQHNGLSHCEAGFSTAVDKAGGLYLGAVGAWDWSGTIVKYDDSEDQNPDIPDFSEVQKVLVNWTKESYLGYALTSGFYNGESEQEYVAIGAPRYRLEGAVVVYRPRRNNANFTDAVTIYPNSVTSQLGSYFGGAMLSVDLNNDQRDDLLVGAPLYIGDNYDDGRVYVYLSNGTTTNTMQWAEASFEPVVLAGTAPGGRFGSAMATAGDLNKDGFNDIVIGAPYVEDNRGAIYIYHGSSTGINPQPKQTIKASALPNDYLRYFGLSIQGGQDLDRNGYPDIAVGAPKSDAVVIFRSRPVVTFSGSLNFSSQLIDVFQCFETPGRRCLTLEVCLRSAGEGVEPSVPVDYTIRLDTRVSNRESKRIEFTNEDSFTPATYEITRVRNVTIDGLDSCWSFNVSVKRTISDYSTPIIASVEYELTSSHTNQPLSSIRDPSLSNTFTAETNFARNCGDDSTCVYNLELTTDFVPPSASVTESDGSIRDLTNGGNVLVISQETENSPITVRVNLTNVGENAFGVRVTLNFTTPLSWIQLGDVRSSNPNSRSPCMEDDNQDRDFGSSRSKRLRYQYSSSLGSIMQTNEWCYFEFNLSSIALANSGSIPTQNITVFAHTLNNDQANDDGSSDDNVTETFPVLYNANAAISERSIIETTVPFNFTNQDMNISSVQQIGENTSDININYQINGLGHSNTPVSTISLSFPFSMIGNPELHLLYPHNYSCGAIEGNAECTCDESVINPYGLALGFELSNDSVEIPVYANPTRIPENTVFDCSTSEGRSSVNCSTFTCTISNLGQNDVINIRVLFRLWSQSLNIDNNTLITFRSGFSYREDSPLIINNQGESVTFLTSTVQTFARLFTRPVEIENEPVLWIYIVAAIGGLLLLILIVIILWKTGFFKSKYAEKKEALEWTEANPDGGDSGSSSGMMKE